jgi:chromosomal replication initiation ATPase DnaA
MIKEEQIEKIFAAVCNEFGVTMDELTQRMKISNSKYARSCQKYFIPKQVASYLLKKHINIPIRKIQISLGYANHNSTIHNVKVTIKVMSVDKDFRERIERIEKALLTINE